MLDPLFICTINIQYILFITSFLRSIEVNPVISELSYKGTFFTKELSKNDNFFVNCFIKYCGKKNWEPQYDRVIYPNLCYNEVCFKETTLHFILKCINFV